MEPVTVGYIAVAILVVLLFSGLHIGVVMGLIGFFGMVYISGWDAGIGALKTVPWVTYFKSYDFSVIPMFVLMGEFCFHGDISGDLYAAAHKFLGSLRGGLAMATVGACAAFAAVSGSSMATIPWHSSESTTRDACTSRRPDWARAHCRTHSRRSALWDAPSRINRAISRTV